MDTSKEYIEMCKKAVEIQEAWKPFNGDYRIQNDYFSLPVELQQPVVLHFCNDSMLLNYRQDEDIWLPRQDQLQEMMLPTLGDDFIGCAPFILNVRLHSSLGDNGIYNWGKTYEQLWLAYVMKEKYGKSWNGTEWR